MPDQSILDYVRDMRTKGFNDDQIKIALRGVGWDNVSIEESMAAAPTLVRAGDTNAKPAQTQGLGQSAIVSQKHHLPHKKLLLISIIVVIVLVIATGAGAYVYLNTNNPQQVLTKVQDNANKIKTLSYDGSIVVQQASTTSVTIKFSGAADSAAKGNVNINFSVPNGTSSSSSTSSLDLSAIYLDKALYLQITKYVLPEDFTALGNMLVNKWIEFTVEDLKDNPMFGSAVSQALKDQNVTTETNGLTDAQKTQIQAEYKKNQFLILKSLGSDTISGESAYHYSVSVDKTKFISYLKEVTKILNANFDQQSVESGLNDYKTASTELWIYKTTYFPAQIKFDFEATDLTKVQGQITFSKFNQPVTVTAPTNAIKINELINQLMSQASTNANVTTQTPSTNKKTK